MMDYLKVVLFTLDYNSLFYSWVISLILTLIIECFLCIPLIKKERMTVKDLINVVYINLLTNPVVVFLANIARYSDNLADIYRISLGIISYPFVIIILEILVVIVEGWLFKRLIPSFGKNAYKYSLYLNGLSFFIGLLINNL